MTRKEYAEFRNKFIFLISNDLVNSMTRRAPVDTGKLRGSMRVVKRKDAVSITMMDYGIYVEFGTAPRVMTTSTGKKAYHPGTRPQPFIRPSIREDLPRNMLSIVKSV